MSKHNFLMFFFYYTIYEEFAYIKKNTRFKYALY